MKYGKITIPNIIFVLVIGSFMAFWGYLAGQQNSTLAEGIQTTRVKSPESRIRFNIAKYFDEKEVPIILAAAKRNKLNPDQIITLFAIRKQENGPKGNEFGIMCPRHINTDLDGQAACASVTIINNHIRWTEEGKPGDFIAYLGGKYAPVDEDDPDDINRHWIPNVRHWIGRIKENRTI